MISSPYQNNLTQAQKTKATIFLIAKYGDVCWYDKEPFHEEIPERRRTIDHLVRSDDDRLQNMVLSHMECQKKKQANFDWQVLAAKQLNHNNSDLGFLKISGDSVRVSEEIAHMRPSADELTDGEVNRIINKNCKSYLEDKFRDQKIKTLLLNETAYAITFLVQEETGGRGSQPAVLRALETRCSVASKFEIVKEKRPFYIIRRTGK